MFTCGEESSGKKLEFRLSRFKDWEFGGHVYKVLQMTEVSSSFHADYKSPMEKHAEQWCLRNDSGIYD